VAKDEGLQEASIRIESASGAGERVARRTLAGWSGLRGCASNRGSLAGDRRLTSAPIGRDLTRFRTAIGSSMVIRASVGGIIVMLTPQGSGQYP